MARYNISKQFSWQGDITDKAADVMQMFGVDISRLKNHQRKHTCKNLEIKLGDVLYITGASGAGKSVIFRELYDQFDSESKIDLDQIELPQDRLVIDCINGKFINSLRLLSKAGLSDVFDVLNLPSNLSQGQKYRFKIATAISKNYDVIFADEFCSNLDRLTASAVACKISQFAKKYSKTLVLASSHDDIIAQLKPDIVIIKYFSAPTQIIYSNNRNFNQK